MKTKLDSRAEIYIKSKHLARDCSLDYIYETCNMNDYQTSEQQIYGTHN